MSEQVILFETGSDGSEFGVSDIYFLYDVNFCHLIFLKVYKSKSDKFLSGLIGLFKENFWEQN